MRTIAAICCVLLVPLATAADWLRVGATPESEVSVDQASVQVSGPLVEVWARREAKKTATNIYFIKQDELFVVNCSNKSYFTKQTILYDRNGPVGPVVLNDKGKFEPIVSGYGMDMILDAACKIAAQRGKAA